MKNSNDTIGNRTRDLSPCSAVPQPTYPPYVGVQNVTTKGLACCMLIAVSLLEMLHVDAKPEEDSQCTYNLISRRVRITVVVVEKK